MEEQEEEIERLQEENKKLRRKLTAYRLQRFYYKSSGAEKKKAPCEPVSETESVSGGGT